MLRWSQVNILSFRIYVVLICARAACFSSTLLVAVATRNTVYRRHSTAIHR